LFCAGHHNIKSWLRVAVKPGIEELTLRPCHVYKKSTSSSARFYQMGLGTQFGFLNLAIVPSGPELILSPCAA
jgi:hypothetical protein